MNPNSSNNSPIVNQPVQEQLGPDYFAGEKQFDFHEALSMIMSRLPWIIAATTLTTILAAIYAFSTKPQYEAKGVLHLALSDRNFANVDSGEEVSLSREDIINTFVATMKNPEVFEKMNEELNFSQMIQTGTNGETNQTSQATAIKRLSGLVEVGLRRNTRLVDVKVKLGDPDLAVKFVNAYTKSFLKYNAEKKSLRVQSANQGLLQESSRLQEKVKASEQALQDYVENELDINIVEQRSLINQNLTSLNESYSASSAKVKQLEGDLQKVLELLKEDDVDRLLEVPAVREDSAVQRAREIYLSQESAMEGLSQRYKEKHPTYQNAVAKLQEYKSTLDTLLKSSPRWIESFLDTTKYRLESIKESIKKAENELLEVDNKAIEYNALTRQIESDRAVYSSVLNRLKEVDVAKELDREIVSVESEAREAILVWPKKPQLIGGGFVGGLALSVGLALFLGYMDNSLKTVDQAEQFLNLPALGAIPVKEKKGKKGDSSRVSGERQVLLKEPTSTCSESIRSMRATINMIGRSEERKVILFTSAVPGEGKSFCSTNYSISLAQQGEKTLLIDLDLRRPSIGIEFDIERNTPGVSDYLLHDTPLEELVVRKLDEKLHILPAGPKLTNPAEQLAGPIIEKLINDARGKYDRVVIDTAPLNAVSDTMSLLRYSQVICLVVRAGKTHRKVVERPLEMMRRAGYPPSGFALNYLPERPGYGSYYYYYYYQGDEYRKGVYGSETEESS